MKFVKRDRSWIGRLLTGLAVTAALAGSATAFDTQQSGAQGEAGGSGGGNDQTRGDDIGTLPASLAPMAPGLIVLGTPTELSSVLRDVQGHGTVTVRPVPGSADYQVEFLGDLVVSFDSRALTQTSVDAYFFTGTTLAGGTAALSLDGVWSPPIAVQPLDAIGLPLGFFASQPSTALISAGNDELAYGLEIIPAGSSLVLSQSLQE